MAATRFLPRVLHVHAQPGWRGGEQQVAYLMHELARRGVPQQLVCRPNTPMAAYAAAQGWPLEPVLGNGAWNVASARRLARAALRFEADVLHLHDARAHTQAWLSTFWGNRLPQVLHRRMNTPPKRNPLSQAKYNHPGLRAILCVSAAVCHTTAARIARPGRCQVVHSVVDLNRWAHPGPFNRVHAQLGLAPHIRLVATTAAFTVLKDYPTFLCAAQLVTAERNDVAFVAFGQGPMEGEMQELAQKLGLAHNVHFWGFSTELPALLPEADVFLFCPSDEALGTSILDAFACRLPIVATQVGGIPEMIVHGEHGLLCPAGDPTRLSEAVLKLLDDAEYARKLAGNGFERAKAFSPTQLADRVMDVYFAIRANDVILR